jgi:glycosyltransferase involved in cell wall biosynthesis
MNISVLIPTLNEEKNLSRCLESVSWSDDIVVFDSFSSDRTVEIARAAGARVIQRRFDNERDHRTASLQVPFKHTWVYNPDADEIATPELRDEMLALTACPHNSLAAYRVRRKDMFMGRWLRHSGLYPTWLVRLFRPEVLTFERNINLRYIVRGTEGKLQGHMIHYSFEKGIEAWFDKHNRYSSLEALEMLASLRAGPPSLAGLLSRDPVVRRRTLKDLSFRLPCRPSLRFLYTYFARLGFLDGAAGLTYCRLISMYEYLIGLKAKEILQAESVPHETSPVQPVLRPRPCSDGPIPR